MHEVKKGGKMNEKDKKLVSIVGEALEQIVLPELQIIKDEVGNLKETVNKGFKENIEQHTEIINSLNRVETLAKSEIKYVDNLSGRVLKLETKKA